MRPNQPPGPRPDDIIRRLRALPVSGWRHGNRIDSARRAMQRLAELAAAARGTSPAPRVPELGAHAIADQLVVLVADARCAGVPPDTVDEALLRLAAELGIAR